MESFGSNSAESRNAGVQARVKQEYPMFNNLGGMKDQVMAVRMSVKRGSNTLLYGPQGCGKTMLARAIANEMTEPFYELSATGSTGENIRDVFTEAFKRTLFPSIIFIDDLDDLGLSDFRTNILLYCMREARTRFAEKGQPPVTVIGAVQQLPLLSQELVGMFNSMTLVDLPDTDARMEMVPFLLARIAEEGLDLHGCDAKIDAKFVAECTEGKSVRVERFFKDASTSSSLKSGIVRSI